MKACTNTFIIENANDIYANVEQYPWLSGLISPCHIF